MSIKTVSDCVINTKRITSYYIPEVEPVEPWFRNPSWLALPSVTVGEQKVVALFSVFDHGANHVAITIFGAYTIDWGDGVIENKQSGFIANHIYDYDDINIPSSTMAPVTFDGTSNTVNRNSHGYLNGQWVKLYNIISTVGIDEGAKYYIINKTDNTFQLTEKYIGDGSEVIVDFNNNGTGTLLDYKQCIITITPQVGQNFTSLIFNTKHPEILASIKPNVNYLDIIVSAPNVTTFTFSSTLLTVTYILLEQFQSITLNNIRNYSNFFNNCTSLRSVPILNIPTSGTTLTLSSMFYNCFSLTEGPDIDISNGSDISAMFAYCYSLRSIPSYNTNSANNMQSMFFHCRTLLHIPSMNASNVTSMKSFAQNCYALETVGYLDVSKVITCSNMFSYCGSLKHVSDLNFAAMTSNAILFNGCSSLISAKRISLPKAINMNSMFELCSSLEDVDDIYAPLATSTYNMFYYCNSLEKAPKITMGNVTATNTMFVGCSALVDVPVYDLSKVTNVTSMFSGCSSLTYVPTINIPELISTNSMFLNCYSLKHIDAINTTNKLTDTTSMFQGCSSLITVPLFDTSNVTVMSNMFHTCSSLKYIPKFNTQKVRIFIQFLYFCHSFTELPNLDYSSASQMTYAFYGTNIYSFTDKPNLDLISLQLFDNSFYQCENYKEMDLVRCNAKNITTFGSNFFSGTANSLVKFHGYGQKVNVGTNFDKPKLSDFILTNVKWYLTLASTQLTRDKLELAMRNLDNVYTSTTFVMTSALGVDTAITKSCTTTLNSNVIACTNTASLSAGMCVVGTGLPQATDKTGVSSTTTNDITLNSHGVQQDCHINIRNINPTNNQGILPTTSLWRRVSYGNGVYLALANLPPATIGTIARSTDGVTWNNINLPATRAWASMFYGNGKWVLCCHGTANIVAVSIDDGVSWIEYAMPAGGSNWWKGAYENGRYIMCSGGTTNGTRVSWSDDAINWNNVTINSSVWGDVAYGNNMWILIGSTLAIASYDNGLSWVLVNSPANITKNQIIYSNDMFIVFASTGTTYYTSTTGITWTLRTLPTGTWMDAGYTPEGKIIIANTATAMTTAYTSDDGCTWHLLTVGSSGNWNACCAGSNNEFVILQSGTAVSSNISSKLNISPEGFRPNKNYYAVNITPNTFQLSETIGGAPITLGIDSDVIFRTGANILSINPNVSITITSNCISTATNTLSFRQINTNSALCKGWTVTY